MASNRYRKVAAHRKLMGIVESEGLDMEDVRAVLKELINAVMPISADEAAVITRIESEGSMQTEYPLQAPQTD